MWNTLSNWSYEVVWKWCICAKYYEMYVYFWKQQFRRVRKLNQRLASRVSKPLSMVSKGKPWSDKLGNSWRKSRSCLYRWGSLVGCCAQRLTFLVSESATGWSNSRRWLLDGLCFKCSSSICPRKESLIWLFNETWFKLEDLSVS
jgi:hypothetical protein